MGGQAIDLWRMPDRIQFPNQYNEYKKQVKDLNKSLQKSGLPQYKENDSAIQMPCVPDFSIELRRSEAHSFRLLVAKLIPNRKIDATDLAKPPPGPQFWGSMSSERFSCPPRIGG
jgi:hypothetical protein